jgi:putative transposase
MIKPDEIVGFKADKEKHRRTDRPDEPWATDCAHLKVIDWGRCYPVTVTNDYSRHILAWELKNDMAATSFVDVLQNHHQAKSRYRTEPENG